MKNQNTAIRTVTLAQLTPDPDQVRKNFDKASIATLAANMKQRGVLVPLLVRQAGKKLIIVDGERRCCASRQTQSTLNGGSSLGRGGTPRKHGEISSDVRDVGDLRT